MPAVAEKPKVSKPSGERRYLSKRGDQVLVMESDKRRINRDTGEVMDTVNGRRLAFREGVLVVPAKGNVKGARNERIPRQDVINFLEGKGEPGDDDYQEPHELFGDREEGFVLMPTPVPAMSEEEAQAVVGFAIEGNVEELERLLSEEEDGYERSELIDLVTDTLSKVRLAQETRAAGPPEK